MVVSVSYLHAIKYIRLTRTCIICRTVIDSTKDFIYLTLMASWLVNLPWINDPTYDFLEFYSGAARVSRLVQASGYRARAFDVEYDCPPEGKSQHSGKKTRSAFDINGESGFVLLSTLN